MTHTVIVVGLGVSGSYLAMLAAEDGHSVYAWGAGGVRRYAIAPDATLDVHGFVSRFVVYRIDCALVNGVEVRLPGDLLVVDVSSMVSWLLGAAAKRGAVLAESGSEACPCGEAGVSFLATGAVEGGECMLVAEAELRDDNYCLRVDTIPYALMLKLPYVRTLHAWIEWRWARDACKTSNPVACARRLLGERVRYANLVCKTEPGMLAGVIGDMLVARVGAAAGLMVYPPGLGLHPALDTAVLAVDALRAETVEGVADRLERNAEPLIAHYHEASVKAAKLWARVVEGWSEKITGEEVYELLSLGLSRSQRS